MGMSNLTVFFDGSCPLCQREIGFYRSRKGAEAITWVDVSAPASPLHGDLSCEAAMRRFHIRDRDGNLLDGGGRVRRVVAGDARISMAWRYCRPAAHALGRRAGL